MSRLQLADELGFRIVDGVLRDRQGRLRNGRGHYFDEQGFRVNEEGLRVDEGGNSVVDGPTPMELDGIYMKGISPRIRQLLTVFRALANR
jgi:hypothetical protein